MDEITGLVAAGSSLAEQYPDEADRAAALARCRMTAVGRTPPLDAPRARAGLPSAVPHQSSRPPRVCIATSDLLGPVRNGGVGTACATLAEALADAGHNVTLLYVGSFEAGDASHWRSYYATRRIAFEVPELPVVSMGGTTHTCASYMAYEWLKRQPRFDVVQFPEINGLGFYALQAKRLGLAFRDTFFCIVLHSPTLWHRTENQEPVAHEDDLVLDFIERESVAWADALVSPTNYLLSWAHRWGFRFPREVYVQPYVIHSARATSQGGRRRVSEIAFFGRLESRKGLEVFCEALGILAQRGALAGTTVTCLGKIGRVGMEDGASFVQRRSGHFGVPVRLETSLGQSEALAYLRARPVLAVMPSLADNMPYAVLECLAEQIPFISAATGGIPEMVAPDDRAAVLAPAEPGPLADLIERALREGATPARCAFDPEVVRSQWIAWHEQLAAPNPTPAAPSPHTPLVSVCIATRNRPHLLEQALATIRRQTYARIEVVLVDDASDRTDALEVLDRLTPEFGERGWRILRRPVKGYPSAARNAAAAHAHGEYLLFMDDDNLARPREIETFVNASLHSSIPILTCVIDQFQSEPGPGQEPTVTLRWLPLGPALTLGMLANRFGDTNMLVRRDTFFRVGGFDEHPGAAFVEDWIFLSRAALAGVPMAVLPEPLFWYRVWEGANGQFQPARTTQSRRLLPYLEGESPDSRALALFTAGLNERVSATESFRLEDAARGSRLTARFERAHEFLTIGPGDAGCLEPEREVHILPIADGILLRSLGTDPIVWLPASLPASTHAIVRIELSTSRPAMLQLFWSTREVPYPSEEHSTLVGFPIGRNVRWAEIPAAAHVGRLRLDPAFAPGDYVLHALEIRCESGSVMVQPARIGSFITRLIRRAPPLPTAERFRRARTLFEIGADLTNVTGMRQVEVRASPTGPVLHCGEDAQVELPAVSPHRRGMVARLDVSSSIATTAQLFWATRHRSYCEEQSARVSLRPGRNVGYFQIPPSALGRLRFDPAASPGDVTLHSLEVRAE